MNNTLYELLVPRISRPLDHIVRGLLILAIVALAAFSIVKGPIFILLSVILGFLSYFLIFPKFHVEYEYTLLTHYLDIDIIYNRAKRKALVSLNLIDAEIIAPVNSPRLDFYKNTKIIDCSSGDAHNSPYAIIIRLDQTMNKILIQPDEKLLQHMQHLIPRTLYND